MDMTFSVEPSGAALGALIHGLDLARSLADEEAAALRRELLQHLLLVFPEQNLTAAQLAGFCRRFGAITRHILDQYHHPEEPDLCIISNTAKSGAGRTTARMAGSYWHSDLSYLADPADFSMLYAIDVPESGGDTIFANLYQAYETLPEDLRARLKGLSAEHDIMAGSGADAKVVLSAAQRARAPGAVHPILRRIPKPDARHCSSIPDSRGASKAWTRPQVPNCSASSTIMPPRRASPTATNGGPETSPCSTAAPPCTPPPAAIPVPSGVPYGGLLWGELWQLEAARISPSSPRGRRVGKMGET